MITILDTCTICYALENKLSAISTNISTLCRTHYQDWSDEKTFGEEY